ncbi:hypothetical protein GCM10010518_06730 [Kitasatospora cinereorecta]
MESQSRRTLEASQEHGPHEAPTASCAPAQPASDEATPECSYAFVVSRLGSKSRQDGPRRASQFHWPCHTSVTNYTDAPGPQSPDLLQRTHYGLAWTPKDGLYNLCLVGPS